MYIYSGLGRETTPSLAAPPTASAGEAQMLRDAAKLAGTLHSAVQELQQSVTFLTTSAQQDLLREMLAILTAFFPTGYGVMDKDGNVIKSSTRYRTEVIPKSPPRDVPFYFHHDTWLFLSYQRADAAGRQRPFSPGHANWIYLSP